MSFLAIQVVFVLAAAATESRGLPASAQSSSSPKTGIELVRIKGGCYQMGDVFGGGAENERPAHEVCVGDFFLGRSPVTRRMWKSVMGSLPPQTQFCSGECPVENVSWNDVQTFLRILNKRTGKRYRLPTEAEWEYAARSGGQKERWAGTSNEQELNERAWLIMNSQFVLHPVGTKRPNGLGLYDMTGNLWQWTADWYDPAYYSRSPKNDPPGPDTGKTRVLRGGYWGDVPGHATTSTRISLSPETHSGGYGFRLAMSAE